MVGGDQKITGRIVRQIFATVITDKPKELTDEIADQTQNVHDDLRRIFAGSFSFHKKWIDAKGNDPFRLELKAFEFKVAAERWGGQMIHIRGLSDRFCLRVECLNIREHLDRELCVDEFHMQRRRVK